MLAKNPRFSNLRRSNNSTNNYPSSQNKLNSHVIAQASGHLKETLKMSGTTAKKLSNASK